MIRAHILKTWRHHLGLQLATTVVLTASFVVIAGVATFGWNLQKILTLWGESFQMSVYLKEDVSTDAIHELSKWLETHQAIEKVEFVDQQKALKLFSQQMASYAPDLAGDADLIKAIPQSFQFSISSTISPDDQLEKMKEIASAVQIKAGVDEVSYGQDWIKSYASLFRSVNLMGAFFILLIVVSAAFVMSNSIRSSISQRRQEIEVLELIGATRRYIRLPYIWEAGLLGLISCSGALAISYAIFYLVKDLVKTQLGYFQLAEHIVFLPAPVAISLLVFAVVVGMVSAYLCVNSINTGWAASQKNQV